MNPNPSSTATQVFDAGWRAIAYSLNGRVIGWTVKPFLIAALLGFGLSWLFWDPAVTELRFQLEQWRLVEPMLHWLDTWGFGSLRSAIAPLVLIVLALPVVMALSMVLVAAFMSPALANLVAERRFPALERKHGGSLLGGLLWALGSTALALVALIFSIPLWLFPGVVLVLPPLIWGWLSYRVFAYDVLAAHASPEERRQLLRTLRTPLLVMGMICGYMGVAPALIFATGLIGVVLAPLLLPVAIWLYMLVFAISALWFAHFCLQALHQQRRFATAPAPAPVIEVLPL